jgi:methylated-DNA-[protein]-cysteine S-methyltransferase
VVDSPIGGVGVAVLAGAVCAVRFDAQSDVTAVRFDAQSDVTAVRFDAQPDVRHGRSDQQPDLALLALASRQLDEYLSGQRCEFDLPLVIGRGGAFERAVWQQIAAIPYGQTRTYGEIARAVGRDGGAQAVGVACNRNPLPIIVACHRVVGANGALVGFGGGVERKRWLLSLEAKVSPLLPPA